MPRWGASFARLARVLIAAVAGFAPAALAARQAPAGDGTFTKSGLHYERAGNGPAIVFVHGSNLDLRIWNDQVTAFAGRFTVVRYDLRFHGKTRDGDAPVSFEADLGEVLDAARLERATIVGLSLGAQVAVDFALAHPARVERLVLVSPTVSGWRGGGLSADMQPLANALRAGDLDGAVRALAASNLMRVAPAGGRDTLARRIVIDNARLFSADPARVLPPMTLALDRLAELKMPVLVLTGELDDSESQKIAAKIHSDVPNSSTAVLASCHHVASMDCPRSLNAAISAFFTRQP